MNVIKKTHDDDGISSSLSTTRATSAIFSTLGRERMTRVFLLLQMVCVTYYSSSVDVTVATGRSLPSLLFLFFRHFAECIHFF